MVRLHGASGRPIETHASVAPSSLSPRKGKLMRDSVTIPKIESLVLA